MSGIGVAIVLLFLLIVAMFINLCVHLYREATASRRRRRYVQRVELSEREAARRLDPRNWTAIDD